MSSTDPINDLMEFNPGFEGFFYYVLHKDQIWRGPWSEKEVDTWISECLVMGFNKDAFKKGRQKVSRVEVCE